MNVNASNIASNVEPRSGGETAWHQPTHPYPRGVELFHQGQMLSEVLYLVSGTVKLTQVDDTGEESIVGLALPGAWLGTAPVIANTSAPVSAVTCSAVVVRVCPTGTFRRLLRDDPKLTQEILEAQSAELCRQACRIGQLCSLSSRKRLQSVLCLLASAFRLSPTGSSVRLRLPLQQWELAQFIGVTPEHLSRLLKDMAHEGVIRRENGWIMLQRLEGFCGD